ncbi:unnamed protein product [Amoebophrya sp. A25]|nr:unnamed protein product [Amoebophrya sp. A25]|eukprot:GSA25T00023818001.1
MLVSTTTPTAAQQEADVPPHPCEPFLERGTSTSTTPAGTTTTEANRLKPYYERLRKQLEALQLEATGLSAAPPGGTRKQKKSNNRSQKLENHAWHIRSITKLLFKMTSYVGSCRDNGSTTDLALYPSADLDTVADAVDAYLLDGLLDGVPSVDETLYDRFFAAQDLHLVAGAPPQHQLGSPVTTSSTLEAPHDITRHVDVVTTTSTTTSTSSPDAPSSNTTTTSTATASSSPRDSGPPNRPPPPMHTSPPPPPRSRPPPPPPGKFEANCDTGTRTTTRGGRRSAPAGGTLEVEVHMADNCQLEGATSVGVDIKGGLQHCKIARSNSRGAIPSPSSSSDAALGAVVDIFQQVEQGPPRGFDIDKSRSSWNDPLTLEDMMLLDPLLASSPTSSLSASCSFAGVPSPSLTTTSVATTSACSSSQRGRGNEDLSSSEAAPTGYTNSLSSSTSSSGGATTTYSCGATSSSFLPSPTTNTRSTSSSPSTGGLASSTSTAGLIASSYSTSGGSSSCSSSGGGGGGRGGGGTASGTSGSGTTIAASSSSSSNTTKEGNFYIKSEEEMMLEASFRNAPRESDQVPVLKYRPRNPYIHSPNNVPIYPTQTAQPWKTAFQNFETKYDLDTLFFVFYYQQGSYMQFLAARELNRMAWRFHRQYLTWFQRQENPRLCTAEYERGSYVYFDHDTAWCQRLKLDFTFDYRYLEAGSTGTAASSNSSSSTSSSSRNKRSTSGSGGGNHVRSFSSAHQSEGGDNDKAQQHGSGGTTNCAANSNISSAADRAEDRDYAAASASTTGATLHRTSSRGGKATSRGGGNASNVNSTSNSGANSSTASKTKAPPGLPTLPLAA